MLEGRESELAAVGERLERVASGGSFALVVQGDPGIGKTALVEAALADRGSLRVIRSRGFESEREIPYAGLHELARPLLELREELPTGQRRALETAFALEPPTGHDRLAVPVALMGLLALAGSQQPLVAVVDDLHWLDPASREALSFLARRLSSEAVGLLMTAREQEVDPAELAGIETLSLRGIDPASARRLLEASQPELAAGPTTELVRVAAGNPLALLELPGALTPAQLTGGRPLADPLPLGEAIEAAFARRIEELPDDCRRVLTLAAATGESRMEALSMAVDHLGLDLSALALAERAGVVYLDQAGQRISFHHPLLRSAAYHSASAEERRQSHLTLAEAVSDPRRRAWHMANAAVGQDEAVAARLEEAGRDARARSGHAEAAHAFARAAELGEEGEPRGRRLLAAAQDFAIAGQFDLAVNSLDAATPLASPDLNHAIARLRGHLAMRRGEIEAAQRTLEEAGEVAFEEGDHVSAATLLLESSVSYTFTGDTDGLRSVLARARRSADLVGDPASILVAMMGGVADVVGGRADDARAEFAAIEPRLADLDLVPMSEAVSLMAHALIWAGDLDSAGRVCDLLTARLREASAVGSLPYPLSVRALQRERTGDWTRALADADEAVRLGEEVGHETLRAYCLAALSRVESGLGETDAAVDHAESGLELARRGGAETGRAYNLAALGRAALAADDAVRAAAVLGEAATLVERLDWLEPGMALEAADHAETLIRLGRREEADAVRRGLAHAAARGTGGNPWSGAACERIALLLAADEADADFHAERALSLHADDGMPFERARTELAWGERLRRLRKRRRAREPLSRALEAFESLGSVPWAARARAELEAAGGIAREPDSSTPSMADLTPHERKVASLVADGMSNREVAAALFLSPKTIERHLSQIYRTLSIRSRNELTRFLAREPGGLEEGTDFAGSRLREAMDAQGEITEQPEGTS